MKVFILLSVIAIAFADRTCPENQHYESCGTACPLTCKNYENPPKICVLMCVSGCFCDEGYVKTEDGRCVKPEECPAQANPVEKTCTDKPETGMCRGYFPMFYYDPQTGTCKKFIYGGCQGNGNRYTTVQECLEYCGGVCAENQEYKECGKACPLTCDNYDNPPKICPLMCVSGCHCLKGFVKTADGRCIKPEECPSKSRNVEKTCLDKPETGMCRGYFPMFYYNPETGTCEKFIYGGCQGNGNRYATEEECLEHCGGVKGKQSSTDICELNPETGLCRGYFPRYYFDKLTGQCKRFIYGGCGGNKNNFLTEAECENACSGSSLAATTKEIDCSAPAEPGLCDAYMPRYYYDRNDGTCKEFIYGGCGGNSNNFRTEDECRKNCKDASVCDQEKVVGPCMAYFRRYFFNKETGKCELFIYGGCRGNGNNFSTKEECESTCVA